MKIVVGCPVAERAWVLPDWIRAIRQQRFSIVQDPDVQIVCLYTESRDQTLQILECNDVTIIESILPTRMTARITNHHWSYQEHEYEYMASLRNTLRKEVLQQDADLFFSLDSDIILPSPYALEQLILDAHRGSYDAIAPLVNMVSDPAFDAHYNFMAWSSDGVTGTRFHAPIHDEAFDAGVIMAAMLLNKKAQCIPWANHRQGEDLGWSLNARRSNLKIGVVPDVKCDHKMRPHV